MAHEAPLRPDASDDKKHISCSCYGTHSRHSREPCAQQIVSDSFTTVKLKVLVVWYSSVLTDFLDPEGTSYVERQRCTSLQEHLHCELPSWVLCCVK